MQPLQPLFIDDHGAVRFRENKIVRFLLDWSSERGMDLNMLARMQFSGEDREQFAQLIGYSLGGYAELDYVSDDVYNLACEEAEKLPTKARSGHKQASG